MRRFGRFSVAAVAVVGVSGLVLSACGDDDDQDAAGPSAPPVYEVTATESADGQSFEFDMPDDIAGGVVTFELSSSADNEAPHDFQLVELPEGHTVDELVAEVSDDEAPLSDWIEHAMGVGSVAPGQKVSATVELKPDTDYGFFCTESSGGEEEGSEEISHADHGMSGTFTTGDDSGAEFSETTASVTMTEYDFTLTGFKAGANSVLLENEGQHLHHALFLPIAEGKTFDDAKAFLSSDEEPDGPPPVDFESGVFTAVFGVDDGGVVDVELKSGNYAVVCFMPDRGTSGPPHAAKGMIKELVIS